MWLEQAANVYVAPVGGVGPAASAVVTNVAFVLARVALSLALLALGLAVLAA